MVADTLEERARELHEKWWPKVNCGSNCSMFQSVIEVLRSERRRVWEEAAEVSLNHPCTWPGKHPDCSMCIAAALHARAREEESYGR